jgi:phosphatidylserine/phosphatidylglycerophosphate/cardiolipin synthase-like enzyme
VAALRVTASAAGRREAAARLDRVMDSLGCGSPDLSPESTAAEEVRFVHDTPGPGTGPRVGDRLVEMFAAATSSIVIESPYLVPSRELLEVLERKSAEGVYVQIVTNSVRSTDGLLPFAGYLKYRRRLVRSGIDIREFRGPDTLHAKTAVIDGRVVVVGSYNIDRRSHHLDLEGVAVVEHEELAREVLDAISVHAGASWRVERNSVPPGERRLGPSASIGLRAARLLLPLFEGQL